MQCARQLRFRYPTSDLVTPAKENVIVDRGSFEPWLELRLKMASNCESKAARELLTQAVAAAFEQCPQGLVGTYRVQHLAQSRFAAELWQPADHGSVGFIVVPDIAVFEATAAVSLYRASAHRKFHCVAEVGNLSPSEDGAITFYLRSDLLQAAEYELILIQRNSQGCEREDHFRILIADPHRPPFEPAMAMRRAARL
jgi:hypothetical protein